MDKPKIERKLVKYFVILSYRFLKDKILQEKTMISLVYFKVQLI